MTVDLDLYLSHVRGRTLVEVLLRGHLWVEKHLIGLIEAEVSNPTALGLDRMSFSQMTKLADGLGLLSPDETGTLRALNKMRNRLAHDLTGEPTEDAVSQLEQVAPESQRGLAVKVLPYFDVEDETDSDAALSRRLSALILALLIEMEMHSQRHTYWKEHQLAMEGYRLMVTIFETNGDTPETLEAYRRAVGIPEPPVARDAFTYTGD